jgi:hypothetical protein
VVLFGGFTVAAKWLFVAGSLWSDGRTPQEIRLPRSGKASPSRVTAIFPCQVSVGIHELESPKILPKRYRHKDSPSRAMNNRLSGGGSIRRSAARDSSRSASPNPIIPTTRRANRRSTPLHPRPSKRACQLFGSRALLGGAAHGGLSIRSE